MEKIKITKIDTKEAEINLLRLLLKNKTYFLNGSWGSGKTVFIKKVEKYCNKRFVYLNLWEIKDNRTVMNKAFDEFIGINPLVVKIFVVMCVGTTILMTDAINLGISTYLTGMLRILIGLVALSVTVIQLLKVKSDAVYMFFIKRFRFVTKDKVLVIDDFDRVSMPYQEEAYKLFNFLKEHTNDQLSIIFIGNIDEIARSDDKYLQKIIDRQIELPFVLHPNCIWKSYFEQLELKLDFELDEELLSLFITEGRNLREQYHFNDYINLELIERNKRDHVQLNQQILVIYLYLFHKSYYQKLLSDWKPISKNTLENSKDVNNDIYGIDILQTDGRSGKEYKNQLETVIAKILFNTEGYPVSFSEKRQPYFIFENVSNLSVETAENILKNEQELVEYLKISPTNSDFYKFMVVKYGEWFPYTVQDLVGYEIMGQKVVISEQMKQIEKISLQLLEQGETSDIIDLVMQKLITKKLLRNSKEDIPVFLQADLKNFDLSQKIYFLTRYNLLGIKDIKKLFGSEIQQVLKNNKKFEEQKKKQYLLFLEVLTEEGKWIYTDQWSKKNKRRIINLDDDEFVDFWRLQRIINLTYRFDSTTCRHFLSQVEYIFINVGRFLGKVYQEDDVDYRNLIDFQLLEPRLKEIAGKYGFSIKYNGEKEQRTISSSQTSKRRY